jgi:superfamily I DNA/RNA helicase
MNQRPTPAQQKIIDEPGHLLVVAGPGSGKTGTIVRRIAAIARRQLS